MSIFSMFALYPRSGYYSGAALEVRSIALLHTFFTLLSSAAVLRHSRTVYWAHIPFWNICYFTFYSVIHRWVAPI